jgi:hypothetical protein
MGDYIRMSASRKPFSTSKATEGDRSAFSYKVVADAIQFRQDFCFITEADSTARAIGKVTKAHVIIRASNPWSSFKAGDVFASYEPVDGK